MILKENIVIALKRKCGELNLSTTGLANEIKISRRTIYCIFKRGQRRVSPTTYRKHSDWLIDQYLDADIQESKKAVMEMTKNDGN